MRFVRVSLLLLLAVVFVGTALADPNYHQTKSWAWGGKANPTAVIPEQEPNNDCPGQSINCADQVNPAYLDAGENDWYQFYGTAGMAVTIQTGPISPDDCTDTVVELYPGCGTSYIARNDDGGGQCLYSLISAFVLPADGYYQILVHGYSTSSSGPYKLDLGCGAVNPPDPNDTCNPDFYLTRCTNGVLNGDMTQDTNNYDPGSGGCSTGFPEQGVDVAYKMDLTAGDVVNMTYYTPGWDAAFYIITDCSNPAGSCVVGADAAYDTEVINWTVPTTGTYWLILDHYGSNTGTGPWTLTYDLQCPGPSGACCDVNGNCTVTYESGCQGTWYGGTSCSPNPCPPVPGACCDPYTGNCTVTLQSDCLAPNQWQGPNTNCDPNLCPIPFPTKESTWGQIKHQYH